MEYDPINLHIYVTHIGSNTVSVIDTDIASPTYNTVINTITVGNNPRGLEYDDDPFNPDNMYVANFGDGTVSVIDTTTNDVIEYNHNRRFPSGIAYDSINRNMDVTNAVNNEVVVIDTTTTDVTGTPIPVGNNPLDIAFDKDDKRMYVANFGDTTVSVIDTDIASPTYNTVIDTITVGSSPEGIAYDSINGDIYVTSVDQNTVSVIDTEIQTMLQALQFQSENSHC